MPETLTDTRRHPDRTIAAFLAESGYADLDAWMAESDFVRVLGDWATGDGHLADPEDAVRAAIEACGYEVRVDDDGLTAEEWVQDLFLHELCCECNGDAIHHTVVADYPFPGRFFARCTLPVAAYPYNDSWWEAPNVECVLTGVAGENEADCTTHGHTTPPMATHWYYQVGDRWVAVLGETEADWFADTDRDRTWTPHPRIYPIDQLPPFGAVYYRDVLGNDRTQEV